MGKLDTRGTGRAITDPGEASSILKSAYAPNSLTMIGRAARLELRLETMRLPHADVGAVRMGGDIRLEAPASRTCCVVLRPVRGGVTISSDGRETIRVSPGVLVFLPPGPFLRYEEWGFDTQLTTLRIDNSVVSAHHPLEAEQVLHESAGPLSVDLREDGARALAWVMHLLAAEMRRPSGTLTGGPAATNFSGFVLGSVLSVVGRDTVVPSPAKNRILRRALAAAEEQAHVTPSIADLAKAAAVSVRTLQEVFRTELGTTPVAYLRSVRLRRVHEELVRSDWSGTTIEAVAHRWGFTNYGRFARLYRTQYGMNPTATLRRGGL